jgi:putative flippase GtrA
MFNALANSWSMIKSSARVLKEDRELLIFPIISAVGIILLTAVFFVPMLLVGYFGRVTDQGLQIVDYLSYSFITSSNISPSFSAIPPWLAPP